MVIQALAAAAAQYGMGKIEANSANKASKKSELRGAAIANWLAQQQYNREVDAYKHRYQWTKESLQEAGYNQALAFMNGGSASNPSSGGTASYAPSSAKGVNMGNISDILNTNRENETAKVQRELFLAQKEKMNAETLGQLEQNKWISPKTRKEIDEATSRIAVNATQSAKNNAETQKTLEEAEQIKGGLFKKIVGTDPDTAAKILNTIPLIGGAGLMGGIVKGYKAYKAMRTARGFGNFIKSIGK